MKHPHSPRRALRGLLTLSLLASTAACWAQVDGRLVQVQGSVTLDGAAARTGMAMKAGTLKTGIDGHAQLRTAGGALIALPPSSELRLAADAANRLALLGGGLRLSTGGADWRVDLPDRNIRINGYLKLQQCGSGCTLAPGLYGRVSQGEAALEYRGGRSVLRGRSFLWPSADTRPEILAVQPTLLDDASSQADAARARVQVAGTLKAGLEAFNAGNDAAAEKALEAVQAAAPGEPVVSYYLGLIALKREDNEKALRLLQDYARVDPEGAASRDVPKTLTLLSSARLQQEVATAVARENDVVSTPPEPGSLAVQAFVNHGNEAYRAMAKGLAAMVIADLSKVPGLKVLEREKVQLLVNEAKLGDSGLADTASAVRSGRLMRAEKVVVGNFEVQ